MAVTTTVALAEKTNFEHIPIDNHRKILYQIEQKKLENGLLFDANSPFLRVTPTLFNTLRLHDNRKFEFDFATNSVILGRHDEQDLINRFLHLCGPAITTISLHSTGETQLYGEETHVYAKTVKEACKNVRRVVLIGDDHAHYPRRTIDSFIHEFVGQVEELELRVPKNVKRHFGGTLGSSIGKHVVDQSTAIKCFRYTGVTLTNMGRFWESIGVTLEELHLCYLFSVPWESTLNEISQHCRKLHTIMLDNPLCDTAAQVEETFTNLLVSYGDQLLCANLHSIDVPSCRKIVDSCPNLRATFIEKRHQFERVSVLGDCIESLQLRVRENADWKPLKDALKKCGRLNTLKLYRKDRRGIPRPLNLESIDATFTTKLMHLQNLHINPLRDSSALILVARSTGNLVSLTVEAISRVGVQDLVGVAMSNPRLECLHIVEGHNRYDVDISGAYVASIIEFVFERWPRLNTLKIHCTQSSTPDKGLMHALNLRLCNRDIKADIKFHEHLMNNNRHRRRFGMFGF